MKNLLSAGLVVLLAGCGFDNAHIRRRLWKHAEGYMLNDTFLFFYKDFSALRNDTLFVLDSAMAVVEGTKMGYFGKEGEIRIRSICAGQIGVYYDQGIIDKDAEVEVMPEPPLEEAPPQPPIPPLPDEGI